MQLSILIPIYNFFVKELVEKLHRECVDLNLTFEIVLVDDSSDEKFHQENEILSQLSNIKYERLKNNIGRSKIRNYLFEKATFQNCLALDCDILIVSSTFIKTYLENIDGNSVLVGGHIYKKDPPLNTTFLLHWKYGSQVESKNYIERSKKPVVSFMTNSFLIQKDTFNQIKFDESIQQYGHEDTVFGIELEAKNIIVKHIKNPVLHIGLKHAQDFLSGEKEAIENLIVLSEKSKISKEIRLKSKLLQYENSIFLSIYYSLYRLLYGSDFKKNLLSDNPSLSILNYWKYSVLSELRKRKVSI